MRRKVKGVGVVEGVCKQEAENAEESDDLLQAQQVKVTYILS
jgi:hypothetical protein